MILNSKVEFKKFVSYYLVELLISKNNVFHENYADRAFETLINQ